MNPILLRNNFKVTPIFSTTIQVEIKSLTCIIKRPFKLIICIAGRYKSIYAAPGNILAIPKKVMRMMLFLVLASNITTAATYTSTQSGTWNQSSTWGGIGTPGSSDDVVIAGNTVVSISNGTPITISNLTVNGTLQVSSTANSPFSLTVSGTIVNNNIFSYIPVNATNVTLSAGNIVNNSSGIFTSKTFSGSNKINVGGNWTNNGTYTHSNSIVSFSGNPSVITGATSFYSVTISAGSVSVVNSATVAINGTWTNNVTGLSMNTGTVKFSGTSNVSATGSNTTFNNIEIDNSPTTFTINRSIDLVGNWQDDGGSFIANNNTVTFTGSSTESISGNTTFYDLKLLNTVDFTNSITTIANNLSNSGSIIPGTSTVIFTGSAGSIIGTSAKNFYNLQINNGASILHTTSIGNIHVDNSFINNGSFTESSSFTFYFDKSGATETFSGTGSTTFGNLTVGLGTFSSSTTLNCQANFAISGTALSFGSNNSSLICSAGTTTFTTNDCVIKNQSSISGTSAIFNNLISNVNINQSDVSNVTITNACNIAVGKIYSIGSNTLALNGVYVGTGTLTGSNTSNLIIGTGSSNNNVGILHFTPNVFPSNIVNNYLRNFTINNGSSATLGDSLNITAGTATNTFGTVVANGTLNAGGYLTLKSNPFGDAIIGNSAGTINDSVTIERYIPARRAWRFLSVPVNSNQSINKSWQEGAIPNSDIHTQNNPKPGFGTEITYNNLPVSGYDVNTTLNPSIKYWDSSANTWKTNNTTFEPINSHGAYCLFIRGSRAVDLSLATTASADATVLRLRGKLNETNGQSITISSGTSAKNSYFFVGNPYASPINIETLLQSSSRTTGIDLDKFWVWDPGASGNYGDGQYVTYSGGVQVPNGSSKKDSHYNFGTTIQSGQAFFVQLSPGSTSGSLQFQQGDKNANETNVYSKSSKQIPVIYTNLLNDENGNGAWQMVDGVGTGLDKNYFQGIDSKNAKKLWNNFDNMALVRDSERLAIEFRPFPILSDTMFYKMFLYKNHSYALEIFSQNLPANILNGWIVDKYLNIKTPINLYDTTLYSFTTTATELSYRDRFMLVYKRVFYTKPIPIHLPTCSSNSGGAKASILNGKIDIYPNPVRGGSKVLLKFINMPANKYELTLSNIEGKVLFTKSIRCDEQSYSYELQLNSLLVAGNYLIKINGSNGYYPEAKLVVTAK